MQAVILAGGKGTRLSPYTTVLPKPLVPVGEYPVLEILIRQLKKHGIKELIISTGHLAQLIEAYFGNGKKFGVDIRYVREVKPLNTAGAIGIIDGLKDNFIVMNGDILTTLDYKKLFQYHIRKKSIATIGTIKRPVKDDYGVIITDKKLELKNYIEKPTHIYRVSLGVYVLNAQCLEYIKKGEAISMPELFLKMKKHKEKIQCYNSKDYWLDIGNLEDFKKAQEEFKKNKRRFL